MTGIVVTGVSRSFGAVRAVDAVDLAVEKGELVTLLGPSGCGKTTLLRMIAGSCERDSGEILVGGHRIDRLSAHRRDIGMVSQNLAVLPNLTVAGNVAYGLKALRIPEDEATRRVEEALALVHLAGCGARKPSELSGGEFQRVAVARALAIRPQLLLLDEPLGNLDPRLRTALRAEIRALQKALGITAVYVTHDQEEAMAISDRIALMNAGRIEQVGRPVDLYRRPASRFAAEFMGATNLIKATELGLAAPVWVSLRPEALRLAEEAPPGWQRLAATVVGLEMLGPITRLDATLASGTPIRVAILDAPQRALAAGAAVSLAFDTSRLAVVP